MNRHRSFRQSLAITIWRSLLTSSFVAALIVACAPAAPATQPPAATEPPAAATEPPAAATPTDTPTDTGPTPTLPVTNCDLLLPAESCDPDWIGRIEYFPLSSLTTNDCTERLLDAGVGECVVFTYTNNGQDFTITVEGADPNVVNDYIGNAQVYFEVQRAGVEPPPDPGLPSVATILLESLVEITGISQEEWSKKRDVMLEEREAEEEMITLAQLLLDSYDQATIDDIVGTAITRATDEYTAVGADPSPIPENIDTLMNEPGASVLVDLAALVQDSAAYHDILMSNPTGLVVTMDWASAPQEPSRDLWVIWYSIDPLLPGKRVVSNLQIPTPTPAAIGAYAYIYYRAKCSVYSSSVQIRAKAGSMTNYFWRQSPYLNVGSRTANIQGTALPPPLSHSSYPTRVAYDTYVRGGYLGGKYYIYGGWVQGYGCQ